MLGSSVGVVICTHQGNSVLKSCLAGFMAIVNRRKDVIFVDNGSAEHLHQWVARHFPGVTILRLEENRLFCGGYNAGIRLAIERGYEFVLIVNADTEVVNSGFVHDLLDAARRWPRAAFLGPKVFYRNLQTTQKTCLQFPGVLRCAAIWVPWRLVKSYFQDQPDCEREVEFLNGVCVLCRVSALCEIGLMDEVYGAYCEDADWSWRARQKNWSSIFVPVPSVIHHEPHFGYEDYSLKSFMLKRNTVYWFIKTGKSWSAWAYARASLALAVIRILKARSDVEARRYKYFLARLRRAYRGLLMNEPLDEWFGPPLGPWDGA